jgi:hypothetical protein
VRSFLSILAAVVLVVMSIAVIGGVASADTGSITGFVYDGSDNTEIEGVATVYAFDTNRNLVAYSNTGTDGYSLELPVGNYWLEARVSEGYFHQEYPTLVTTGTAGVNFYLTAGFSIKGTVCNEDNMTENIESVQVLARNTVTGKEFRGSSLANGSYSVTVFPGTYKVRADRYGWAAKYYDNVTVDPANEPAAYAAADSVMVEASDNTGIDFSLRKTGYISGHVCEADGGAPIQPATVTAYDIPYAWAAAGNSGASDNAYYFINLSAGSYKLKVEKEGFITRWYTDNVANYATEYADGDPVVVTDNLETADINFFLLAEQAVNTNPATELTYNSARLNGELTSLGAADNVTVSFMWGTESGGLTSETPGQVLTDPGAFYHDLGSLTPGTTYYYRAKADGDGTDLGDEESFTTDAFAAPTVETNDASIVTATSATLNGNLTSLGTATTDNVSFEWGLDISYGNETAVQARTAPGAFSAGITGLTDNTTYHFRAKAVGDGGAYGEDKTFTTPSAALLLVTTGGATSVTTTSATLNGTLTSLGAADNVTVSFIWGTTAGGPYPNVTDNQTLTNTGAFSADLSGLASGTAYYYKAKAVGADTVYGNEVSLTTSTTPPTVTTSAATSLAATSATLNGNLTALGTATSVSVSFEWGTSTSYGTETTAQSATAIGAFTADLTGLTANTTYHVRAKAVGHGAAVYGDDITFTTPSLPDTTAPTISAVASTGITKTGATITWTTNEAATSRVEYGLTEEYGSFTTLDTSLVTAHSVELTGLKAGKTYHYRVISGDASDNEALSGDNTLKTSSKSGGMPVWGWVLIGLAVVAVAGAGAFLLKGKLQKS